MFKDCCFECGHLLSQQRNLCPFCGWRLQDDQYADTLESNDYYEHLYLEDIGSDQFSASHTYQRAGL